jgi:biofilm PGA synthesis N-glycosyltransferase PgaC
MEIILAAFLTSYCAFLVILIRGWHMAALVEIPSVKEQFITVIIPVRNEEKCIKALLNNISLQVYDAFEVIVVDDHSEDQTMEILSGLTISNLVLLKNSGIGKKQAINTAIACAKGSIIVTTDGDCSVQPQWLKSINSLFSDNRIAMVLGGVAIQSHDFFSRLQGIEMASLVGTAASTVSLGYPTMCNGANLAFKKQAFEKVLGYADNLHIPSGDDEFLLHKINRQFPGGVKFLYNEHAVVRTRSQLTVADFLQQRLRWAAKWRFNTSRVAKVLAVFILSVQLSFLVSGVALFVSFQFLLLALLLAKILLEAFYLWKVCNFLKVRWAWLTFLVLQVAYPFYVVMIGITSNFMTYTWKGRKHY